MATDFIKIQSTINTEIEQVWKLWTRSEHIEKWNTASADWHTTKASNNLVIGGKFSYRMEAKDGSFGFDFCGIYDEIIPNHFLAYTLDDNRKVVVRFHKKDNQTLIEQKFEPETENPLELQEKGWQAILNNFNKYAQDNLDV